MPIRHIPDPSLTQPPSAFPEILDRAIAAAEAKGEKLDILPLDVEEEATEEKSSVSPQRSNQTMLIVALVVVFVVLPLVFFLGSIFLIFLAGAMSYVSI